MKTRWNKKMDEQIKQKMVEKGVMGSRNDNGLSMKVPVRRMRFPVVGGIQHKITLKSNVTGTFMNIGFMKEVENTINGNIADELLNRHPDIFRIIKVNGKIISAGKEEFERDIIKKELLDEIRQEFEIKPKAPDTKRARVPETQLAKGTVPIESKVDKNTFSDKHKKE